MFVFSVAAFNDNDIGLIFVNVSNIHCHPVLLSADTEVPGMRICSIKILKLGSARI